jgi:hypothetical protein
MYELETGRDMKQLTTRIETPTGCLGPELKNHEVLREVWYVIGILNTWYYWRMAVCIRKFVSKALKTTAELVMNEVSLEDRGS